MVRAAIWMNLEIIMLSGRSKTQKTTGVCSILVVGLELKAYTLNHSMNPFFVTGFFKIGSCELFAWAGFEL
jgi:hypothetical protein